MCLCAFSIMTMAASTMAPMAMAMPPRLMMLELMPSQRMAMKAISTPTGSIRIATSALRTCSRNSTQTSGDDQRLLDQRALQRFDGALDQFRAVVDGADAHALGQAAGVISASFVLDVGDHLQRVLAVARHGDARHHLAFAVEFGDAAPLVGHQLDAGDVANQHRRAACPPSPPARRCRRCRAGSRDRAPCTRSRPSPGCGRRRRDWSRGSRCATVDSGMP